MGHLTYLCITLSSSLYKTGFLAICARAQGDSSKACMAWRHVSAVTSGNWCVVLHIASIHIPVRNMVNYVNPLPQNMTFNVMYNKLFDNVGKGKHAGNQHFLLFSPCFLTSLLFLI